MNNDTQQPTTPKEETVTIRKGLLEFAITAAEVLEGIFETKKLTAGYYKAKDLKESLKGALLPQQPTAPAPAGVEEVIAWLKKRIEIVNTEKVTTFEPFARAAKGGKERAYKECLQVFLTRTTPTAKNENHG